MISYGQVGQRLFYGSSKSIYVLSVNNDLDLTNLDKPNIGSYVLKLEPHLSLLGFSGYLYLL